jgi:hypothetical protein
LFVSSLAHPDILLSWVGCLLPLLRLFPNPPLSRSPWISVRRASAPSPSVPSSLLTS